MARHVPHWARRKPGEIESPGHGVPTVQSACERPESIRPISQFSMASEHPPGKARGPCRRPDGPGFGPRHRMPQDAAFP